MGAGPVITFDDEPTDISLPGADFKACRRGRANNISVYDPELKLNLGDEEHVDMVRGTYSSGTTHQEENDYTRDDLTADANGDAFLVRLRRTADAFGHDAATDVSIPSQFVFRALRTRSVGKTLRTGCP